MEEIKTFTCDKCGRTQTQEHFYKDKKSIYDCTCKECVVKNLDIDNKDDILSFCKRYNIPYIEKEYNKRVEKEKNSPYKDTLELKRRVFGKYLSLMKLKAFMYFTFDDTEEIAQRELLKHTAMPIPEVTREDSMEEADKMEKTHDNVNHPAHYEREGAMECIDEMVMIFGKEAVKDFCKCNAWKYRYRSADKNGAEDIAKSDWYIRKYKELSE